MGVRASAGRGFTILEMLVTIGILVVVTAGVATIFTSIGEMVSKGRKVSELNQFAARLERVMREDFKTMTREGFMVIVHKNANGGRDVPLFRGEQTNIDALLYPGFSNNAGRVRRSDEIMFFSRGNFESARPAIANGMIPRSHEAAIYYGHGQKRRPQTAASDPMFDDPNNLFFNPAPWDTNYDTALDTRVGYRNIGFINPNEFARDWSLLRQVTLLVNPRGPGQQVPEFLFGLDRTVPADRVYLEDSDRQISLQPAGRSIFTSLSGTNPSLPVGVAPRWLYDLGTNVPGSLTYPSYRVSGLVDVVTEDLTTIRGMIQALPFSVDPSMYFDYTPGPPEPMGANPISVDRDTFSNLFWGDPLTSPRPQDALQINVGQPNAIGTAWGTGDAGQLTRMRKWMIDALPSRWDLNTAVPRFVAGVRYEDIPTRLLYEDSEFALTDMDNIRRAYTEANQEMLGSSVFVPRCTEFIVEWSYGFVDNTNLPGDPGYKEMLWYGLDRTIDSNNDGVLDPQTDGMAARLYTARTGPQAGADFSQVPPRNRTHGMLPEQVVGRGAAPFPMDPDLVEIATFGFDANTMPGSTVDSTWLWPKFIRITMSLGDPSDKQIEQTYQIVFEVPGIEQ